MTTEPTKPRRRRWFSLSLRGLMLLILVVGGLMGWKARKASLQRRAVAKIEALGGSVVYDWEPDDINPIAPAPSVTPEPPGPVWLRRILGDEYFQDVVEVTLSDTDKRYVPLPPPVLSIDEPESQANRDASQRDAEITQAAVQDDLACLNGLDRIETLSLRGKLPKSAGLARLGRLQNLRSLTCFDALNDEALEQVAKLSRLEYLFCQIELSDDSKLKLLEHLPRLNELIIRGAPTTRLRGLRESITPASPELLAKVPWDVTDTSLAHLGKLGNLTHLDLYGTSVTDAGLAHLQNLKNLKHLELSGSTKISDAGLVYLSALDSMETLMLKSAQEISDSGLSQLAKLKKLEHLELSSATKVTDLGMASLARLNALYWLDLGSATGVTDLGMAELAKLAELRFLTVNIHSLTGSGLKRLQSLTKLRILELIGGKIKGEILDEIQAAIPGVTIRAERIGEIGAQVDPALAPPQPTPGR